MNLWHDVPLGDKAPEEFNAIVEIPCGSRNKYEIDKETGMIALDRVLHTAQVYPADYGFAPQTLWDDDDALDVVILTTVPMEAGILVRVRPIGIMKMMDSGESDDKVVVVPTTDPRWKEVKDIGDANQHQLREIQHFFETYKNLQDKVVEISGYEGRDAAVAAVKRSMDLYAEKHGK